jgi:hypothetical protein
MRIDQRCDFPTSAGFRPRMTKTNPAWTLSIPAAAVAVLALAVVP